MVYVHNGKVVDSRPFSVVECFNQVVAYVIFFFSSMLSVEPLSTQIQEFQTRHTARSSYAPFTNILGFQRGGGGGNGGGDGHPTATGRRSTVRSFPQAPLAGACGASG